MATGTRRRLLGGVTLLGAGLRGATGAPLGGR